MRFFHGTLKELPINFVLEGRWDAYEKDWGHTEFYQTLEKYRPEGMIPHKEAVFLCHHPDHVDAAGAHTDYICEMKVLGNIQRHDMNWSTQISCLISEGHIDSLEIQHCAYNYWNGVPHPDDNMWEYLTKKAVVLSCEPFEDTFLDEHICETISHTKFEQFKTSLLNDIPSTTKLKLKF